MVKLPDGRTRVKGREGDARAAGKVIIRLPNHEILPFDWCTAVEQIAVGARLPQRMAKWQAMGAASGSR